MFAIAGSVCESSDLTQCGTVIFEGDVETVTGVANFNVLGNFPVVVEYACSFIEKKIM